jgi:hypothetical protein
MNDDTRARFFAAIAQQLPADRVIEVHLFPAIKQGGMESGVAVLAVERDLPAPSIDVDGGYVPASDVAEAADVETHAALAVHDQLADETAFVTDETQPSPYVEPTAHVAPSRYIVYSARYRHTLKGMDRGKWEVTVTDEADAPLLTIDAVVRGVQRRSGDVDDTMRLSGDEFRATLPGDVSP